MNSPYMGKFQVTQEYKGSAHDGLDLVGIDSKEIHATISGVVQYAGWENSANQKQGFGQYVCIKGNDGKFYYYGHMSKILVSTGAAVQCTDTIGIEGNTGYSFGSHCHYCIRPTFSAGNSYNVSEISGIPNSLGTYDDGYRPNNSNSNSSSVVPPADKNDKSLDVNVDINGEKYSGTLNKM